MSGSTESKESPFPEMRDAMAIRCDLCGKRNARIRRVSRTLGQGKTAILVEQVPVVVCPDCGESYMTSETLKELERIRVHRRQVGVPRRMLVTRFGGAA